MGKDKKRILKREFFDRPALAVAKELLGKYLVRKIRGKENALMITEVEVYDGFDDKASHAHKGITDRNKTMFGGAGIWYVYLVYGMHNMLNIVTGGKGHPSAVLIRGVYGINGPGKLTKSLSIGRKLNGKSASKKSGMWLEERGMRINDRQIKRTPRIGVHYAGEIWSKKPYRFVLMTE